MYLIVECHELGDQWECDADRTPVTLVEDWRDWFVKTNPDYMFEVYELQKDEFILVKKYEDHMEHGMSLHFWGSNDAVEDKPTVVQKWINATRSNLIPADVYIVAKEHYDGTEKEMIGELHACGSIGWEDEEGNWWVYGEYYDCRYSTGC